MAEQFLEDIYQYSKIVSDFREVVELIRMSDDDHSALSMEAAKEDVQNLCKTWHMSGRIGVQELWDTFQYVYRTGDIIVRADMIESIILPKLEEWIQSFGCITQQVDDSYQLESTATGFLTIKSLRSGIYLHSNNDPMDEARKQMDSFYIPSAKSYSVYGCGLGYEVYQLYKRSRGSIVITLFESNPKMVEYAQKYGVLDWVPKECLKIVTKDALVAFLESADGDQVGTFMYRQSILDIEDQLEKDTMLRAFSEFYAPYLHKKDQQINFYRNIQSDAKPIDELDTSRIKDEMIIVAAGPSLDEELEQLRAMQGKKTIVAVGTVFAKLIKAGIRPDFVVVADPQERTARQIEGLENETVPLLMDAAAYWGFSGHYKGEKYYILTSQMKEAKDYALRNNLGMWASGGTVTFLATEFAIRFQAKSVYLIGVDLAYPGGMSHASGTLDCEEKSLQGLLEERGVLGQTVYTTYPFQIYLRAIENRIAKNPQIAWYNLSTLGAHIEGTVETGGVFPEERKTDGKISVIVPCYNAEETIRQCADALLKQSLGKKNLELIFVDEASTDSTYDILREYQEKEECIRVFRLEKNGMQGEAKNVGLCEATGKYIGFSDADGYVESNMYEKMYNALQSTGADVAICGRWEELSDGRGRYEGPGEGGFVELKYEKYVNDVLTEKASSGVAQKLYKKEILDACGVLFPEGMAYEDNFFNSIVNYYVQRAALVKEPLHHYRINLDSVCQKRNEEHYLDRLRIEIMKVEELKKRGLFSKYRLDIEKEFMRLYFANTILALCNRTDEIPDGILQEMQDTVKKLFSSWRKNSLIAKGQEQFKELCELADHPFQKGDREELKAVLTEKGIG